jgi:hypothetical protein
VRSRLTTTPFLLKPLSFWALCTTKSQHQDSAVFGAIELSASLRRDQCAKRERDCGCGEEDEQVRPKLIRRQVSTSFNAFKGATLFVDVRLAQFTTKSCHITGKPQLRYRTLWRKALILTGLLWGLAALWLDHIRPNALFCLPSVDLEPEMACPRPISVLLSISISRHRSCCG